MDIGKFLKIFIDMPKKPEGKGFLRIKALKKFDSFNKGPINNMEFCYLSKNKARKRRLEKAVKVHETKYYGYFDHIRGWFGIVKFRKKVLSAIWGPNDFQKEKEKVNH